MGTRLGLFRSIYLVCICCTGSFLFAYDTGIVGGVLLLPSFQHSFGYEDSNRTIVNAICVSILQAGAFIGCFLIWPITYRFGRRLSLILCSMIFCVGGVIQTIDSHSLPLFYAGRVISGVAVGAATVLIPMYSAEMAPKEMRGRLGGCFQLLFAVGVATSYWIDWIVGWTVGSSAWQWQIPVGLQLIPGGILGFGMLYVKESARWLASKDRLDEAYSSLVWVRGGIQTDEVESEFAEIIDATKRDKHEKEGFSWKELCGPSTRYRVFIAVGVQFCAQMTGNTSLAYYAPQIFAAVGAGASSLLMTGFFGVAKIFGVVLFQIWIVDRVGRRRPFILGAAVMGTLMLCIAFAASKQQQKTLPSQLDISVSSSAAAIIAILLIFTIAAVHNASWAPLPWIYIGEIFSSRTREVGVASGAASQWLFNFLMSQATPYALANIGWRAFILFGVFNYGVVIFAVCFLRETKGRSLEEMDEVFDAINDDDTSRRRKHRNSNDSASRRLIRDE